MTITTPDGEPVVSEWRATPEADVLELLLHAVDVPTGRPAILAVDGRGASGKSTLAGRLHRLVGRSAIVHTDDIAWHEPYFAWGDLLAEHVLRPLRRGEGVSFRPSAWEQHGREGAIEVPAGLDLVIVEGVGASQRELADLIDATVWVQSDFATAEERGIARDIAEGVNGDDEQTIAFWHEWMEEELRFLQRQRPWERARAIVAGTPPLPLAENEVAIALGPLRAS
jgi:uridine kinase